jgi:3-(3-hydroxy-phenyl)propionate hydroxylase
MPGEILPDLGAATAGPDGGSHACHLQSLVSGRFAALCFFGAAQPPADDKILGELAESVRGLPCDIIVVASGEGIPAGANSRPVVTDPSGALHDSFGAIAGTVYLIRPDHHIAAGWRQAQPAELRQAVEAALGRLPIPTETRK